jgi:DNA-binding PadR family transcriptional regulator
MDADERDICNYLKTWPGQFVSGREISRRAGGKRRYREEPAWSTPVLSRLVEKGLVESDSTGHYRLRREEKKERKKKWVSPHIRKILEKSGKNYDAITLDAPEDSYER